MRGRDACNQNIATERFRVRLRRDWLLLLHCQSFKAILRSFRNCESSKDHQGLMRVFFTDSCACVSSYSSHLMRILESTGYSGQYTDQNQVAKVVIYLRLVATCT